MSGQSAADIIRQTLEQNSGSSSTSTAPVVEQATGETLATKSKSGDR